jgi:hypothetical protein
MPKPGFTFTDLKRAYRGGEKLKAMSERTGLSVGELSIRLRAGGCKMRARGRIAKAKNEKDSH